MTNTYNLFNRVYNPKDVGNVSYRDEFGSLADQRLQFLYFKVPFVVNSKNFKLRSFSLAKHLPRNNVGVVLFLRDNDLISLHNQDFSQGKSDKINGSRCS